MTKDILWLWERDKVFHRGHEGGTARKKTEEETAFWRQQRNRACRTGGGLYAMDEDEKMDEDNEVSGKGEIRDEEQEEEHQKARAIASPILPSRREVEDHNLLV